MTSHEISKGLKELGWRLIEDQQLLLKLTNEYEKQLGLPTEEEMVQIDPQAYDAEPVEVVEGDGYSRMDSEPVTAIED